MNGSKRLVSILLALCVLTTMVAAPAAAGGTDDTGDDEATVGQLIGMGVGSIIDGMVTMLRGVDQACGQSLAGISISCGTLFI